MSRNVFAPLDARYGSHRGLIRLLLSFGEVYAGDLRHVRNVRLAQARRLVFVCQGNVCRSPFAAAYARSSGLEAVSFGISTGGDMPANEGAMEAARRWRIDLSSHVTTDLAEFRARDGDLLLAMEPRQVRRLATDPRVAALPTSLLGLWSTPARPHIHDPYGLSPDYFDTCFSVIVRAVDALEVEWTNARTSAATD